MSNNITVYTGFPSTVPESSFEAQAQKCMLTPNESTESEGPNFYDFFQNEDAERITPRALQDYQSHSPWRDKVPALPIDVRVLQTLQKRLQRLSSLRGDKVAEGVRLMETRKALKDSRNRTSQALSECLKVLRQLSLQRGRYKSHDLDSIFEQTRTLHDVYGTLEAEYHEAEYAYIDIERLCISREWECARMEEEIQRYLARILSGDSVFSSAHCSERSSSVDSYERTPDKIRGLPEQQDGLVREYKVMLGKLEMLREALGDLEAERAEIWDEQRAQNARGLELNSSNQQFLDDFYVIYEDAAQELREAEEEAQSLRQRMFNSLPPETPRRRRASSNSQEAIERWRSKDSSDNKARMQHYSDPGLWTSQSESGLESLKHTFAAVRQRISDWILDNLDNNRLEKARHKAMLHKEGLTDEEWWRLVRKHWDKGMEWETDLHNRFETLKDSYTEYKQDSSNTKNLSSARVTVLESRDQSANGSEIGFPMHIVWPHLSESQCTEVQQAPFMIFPPTPPDSVREFKKLRHSRSATSLRFGLLEAELPEAALRKSWSG